MPRTPLKDRTLPNYTRGNEIFNMVSHIVGAALGIVALVTCVIMGALRGTVWSVVSGAIFGASMILLYTISSVYHGLKKPMAKKVMQVLDHCTIYLLIAGTYTPVTLVTIRSFDPAMGWVIFGVVWAAAILGSVFTAIDFHKYRVLSYSFESYLGHISRVKATENSATRQGPSWRLAPPLSLWGTLAGFLCPHLMVSSPQPGK